jgi:hypothetical protein
MIGWILAGAGAGIIIYLALKEHKELKEPKRPLMKHWEHDAGDAEDWVKTFYHRYN